MGWIAFAIVILAYFAIGPILYGLMRRYDPRTFDGEALGVGLIVFWWPILIPLYWFAIYCDRCIVWFEKKKEDTK